MTKRAFLLIDMERCPEIGSNRRRLRCILSYPSPIVLMMMVRQIFRFELDLLKSANATCSACGGCSLLNCRLIEI